MDKNESRRNKIIEIFDNKYSALEFNDNAEVRKLFEDFHKLATDFNINPDNADQLSSIYDKILEEKMKQAFVSGYEYALSITLGI